MALTRLLSVEDLEQMGSEGEALELYDGVPREHTGMSWQHGRLGVRISSPLYFYVASHALGEVFTSDTLFTLARHPDTVVRPDVSFVRSDRRPPEDEWDRIARIPPDLAVEVVSPTDRPVDIMDKIERYQAAGVPLLWLVEPGRRTVTVYTLGQDPHTLREADILHGGDVIPGFTLPIAEIFQ